MASQREKGDRIHSRERLTSRRVDCGEPLVGVLLLRIGIEPALREIHVDVDGAVVLNALKPHTGSRWELVASPGIPQEEPNYHCLLLGRAVPLTHVKRTKQPPQNATQLTFLSAPSFPNSWRILLEQLIPQFLEWFNFCIQGQNLYSTDTPPGHPVLRSARSTRRNCRH